MILSANTQAVLLLTVHFTKAAKDDVKPLTNREWGQFALWLKERNQTPEMLLVGDPASLLNEWRGEAVTLQRLEQLLNRGAALGLAVEKWSRAGIWILTRSDSDYPISLKRLLKHDSPPVLFGCGNRALLNQGGIAVVGSRDAQPKDLDYSRQLGELAAASGYSIVSGGARGIDETAMLGALAVDGMAIGVLSDSLLRAATSSRYRPHLMRNNLALISPFYPEAGFSAGNAMQRNKYIYCLSHASVAVHSGTSGGTWSGATENLRRGWVPLWVKPSEDPSSGNSLLIAKGGRSLPEKLESLKLEALFEQAVIATDKQADESEIVLPQPQPSTQQTSPTVIETPEVLPGEPKVTVVPLDLGFYDFFLLKLQCQISPEPKSEEQLLLDMVLTKQQLGVWLKLAMEQGKVKKLTRPVRYQWIALTTDPAEQKTASTLQQTLF